jgi:hypothetical protein
LFDANPHHVQLTRAEFDIAVAHANGEATAEHHHEVIGVVVVVPDKLTLDLHHHDVVPVELRDGVRRPVFANQRQFLGQVDWVGLGSRHR